MIPSYDNALIYQRKISPQENFLPYHAVRADLLARTQRPEAARAPYCKALALEPNSAGRRWLERKAALLVVP
jgi:RNA polymerase sigma-70 factor (ECF subfamily)